MYRDSHTIESQPRRFYELTNEEQGRVLERISVDVLRSAQMDGLLGEPGVDEVLAKSAQQGNLRPALLNGLRSVQTRLLRSLDFVDVDVTHSESVGVNDVVIHRTPFRVRRSYLYMMLLAFGLAVAAVLWSLSFFPDRRLLILAGLVPIGLSVFALVMFRVGVNGQKHALLKQRYDLLTLVENLITQFNYL